VVVVLPDTGRNYLSKFFSDEWLEANDLVAVPARRTTLAEVVAAKQGAEALLFVRPEDSPAQAARLMEQHGVSQLPVIADDRVVGGLNEVTLAKLLHEGHELAAGSVADVMGQPLPVLDAEMALEEAYRLLLAGHGGVVVSRDGRPWGFLARIDLIHYWASAGTRAG
jgi:cystathionine beta-synthase